MLSVLLIIVLCLSLLTPIPASALTATLTFQYTAADSGAANAKFKAILGTWNIDSTEKTTVSGNIDTSYTSATDICGAILSSVADGYILSGWKVTIGSTSTTYLKDQGNKLGNDYEFGYWFDNTSSWVSGDTKLGGVIVCYDPGDNVVIEPILIIAGSPCKVTIAESQTAFGTVSAKDELSNTWQLTATPALDYALDHWAYKGESTSGEWATAEDSYGELAYTVEIDEDREYKAVFAPAHVVLDDGAAFSWNSAMGSSVEPIRFEKYFTDYVAYFYEHKVTPVVGDICRFILPWHTTGTLEEIGLGVAEKGENSRHNVRIILYIGDDTQSEPFIDSGKLGLAASVSRTTNGQDIGQINDGQIAFFFLLPATETMTVSMQLDDQEPVVKTYRTGQNLTLTNMLSALEAKYNDIDNPPLVGEAQYTYVDVLKYRYLIDTAIKEANAAYVEGMNNAAIFALGAAAEEKIIKYFTGEDKSYITVSFGGKNGGADGGNIVRVKDKVSQSEALIAALEQVFPREKGYWYLDCNAGTFGLWVNGYGGRFFTETELESGTLETSIVAPSRTFAAGEPLPKSGLVMGSQKGGAQYWVNGFYANFGISGWLCSNGDRFTWGPSGDDGIPDWDEEGGEPWMSPLTVRVDENVYTFIMALTAESSDEDINAGRTQYNAMLSAGLSEFWNPSYGRWLASHDFGGSADSRMKEVNDHLSALEKSRGLGGDPLPTVTYTEAMAAVLGHIASRKDAPTFGSEEGEWAVLALARGGVTPSASYYGDYYNHIAQMVAAKGSGRLDDNVSTDNARLILALSAIGADATNVGGHDLIAPFEDHAWVVKQGLNGAIFALLALDTNDYAFPNTTSIESPATRDGLIEYILEDKCAGGGWSLYGKSSPADVDITAMALQALAPYYHKVADYYEHDIVIAVNEALEWLKTQQDGDTGGFNGYNGTVSTCSTAQVITALCALGMNPTYGEYGFTKDGGWNPITALLSHYNDEGWFGEEDGEYVNAMATEQAAYALVAYDRYMNSQPRLYDMSDAFTRASDTSVASVVVHYGVDKQTDAKVKTDGEFTAEIPYGAKANEVTVKVTTAYHRAAASDPAPPSSDNPAWTFTVTAQDGTQQQYTLTVTNADNPNKQNAEDVEAARKAVEGAKGGWSTTLNTSDAIKEWLQATVNAVLTNTDVAADVRMDTFTAAIPGTSHQNKDGTIGTYTATVTLSKGTGDTLATDATTSISGTFPAMPYTSSDSRITGISVGGKNGVLDGTNITVNLAYGTPSPPTDPDSVKITVSDVGYATVTSGPVTNDEGLTWTFTVTAEDKTYTEYMISVGIAQEPIEESLNDIKAAKSAIENHDWTLPANVANVDEWIAGELETLKNNGELNGVAAVAGTVGVTAAIPGNKDKHEGTDGVITAAVALSTGAVEEGTYADGTAVINGTIPAEAYIPANDASLASVTVQDVEAELTANAFSVTLPYTAQPVVVSDIEVVTTDANASYEIEQGANGAWTITVTAENGTTTAAYTLAVTIPANPNAANADTVAEVKAYLESAAFSVSMLTANDEDGIESWLDERIAGMQLGDVEARIDDLIVTAALPGTAENTSGTPGSFTAKIALTKGGGDERADGEAEIAGAITATPYRAGGGTVTDKQITVSFRLIGATRSEDDVDLKEHPDNWQGSGYQTWIATRQYAMYEGQTNYDLFDAALKSAGITAIGADKNYVKTINAPKTLGEYALSEFTNGKFSGWMYTVNGVHPGYGLKEYPLRDGDVVIWHYVNDYRFEVHDWFHEDKYPALGDASTWNKWLDAADENPSQGSTPTTPGSGNPADPDKSDDETTAIDEPKTALGGGGGGNIVATETVAAETKAENGKAAAAVAADAVTEAAAKAKESVEAAKEDGIANAQAEVKIVAKADGADGAVKAAEVGIPAEAVKAVADAQDLVLTVESDVGALTLDAAALTAIASTAKDGDTVKITAEAVDNSTIDLTIAVGDTPIAALGGTATVSLPYTPDSELAADDYDLLTVYYIDEDGSMTEMKGARYDAATGSSTFVTEHLGKFKVSEWISPFDDIAKGEWYYKAARFAYSNDLITGTTDTTFAPQTTLTRAMLITVLARDAGIDTSGGDTWYSKAAEWGMETGLTDGTNMDGEITREQFATLLYRYRQFTMQNSQSTIAADAADISAYTDAGDVSEWAREAMEWAVGSGLVTGRTATTLAPRGTATRAEAAMLLQRYLENMG
jgi:hypothetical protein